MTQSHAASVQAACLRITALNASGAPATGANSSYVMTSTFQSVSFTPEFEEGDEITVKGADGSICISYKGPDTLKRVTLEVAICEPDPEFTALLSGGTLLVDDDDNSVGWAAPATGTVPNFNGVALEVWSYAVSGGKRSAVNPYFHWVFPYVQLNPSGDRVMENDAMANTFSGWGVGNDQFDDGPQGDWPYVSDRPYQYARSATAPVGINGYQTVA